MALPSISIITPSFNSASYIEQTIDSILSQSYPSLEYIIIDGGSKDGTQEIIKKYARHLSYWVSESDTGQSAALNKGFKVATGEIVNWLNADDFYTKDSLRIVAEAFNDPNALVVSGRCRVVESNGDVEKFVTNGTDLYADSLAKTIGWARIDQPSTFFRRSSCGYPFEVNEQLHYIMDRELWCRFLLSSGLDGIRFVDKVLVNFRHHELSKTISNSAAFEKERLFFYYTLAVRCNLAHEIEVFNKLFNVDKLMLINLSTKYYSNSLLIKSALNYFFLLLASEYYVESDRQKVKYLTSIIDEKLLQQADVAKMKEIRWRATYLPTGLVSIFRKLKSWI